MRPPPRQRQPPPDRVTEENAMRRKLNRVVSGLLLATFTTFSTSCSTMSGDAKDQVLGGTIGALAGAAIGAAASGGKPEAILAGAAAGAVVGWGTVKLIQYNSERTRSAKEEADVLGYKGQGTMLNIRDAQVTPETVRPGQEVSFAMDYAVLAPKSEGNIAVVETWQLEKDGKVLSTTRGDVQRREPGGWSTRAGVSIPKNAKPGSYIVRNQVTAFGQTQERVSTFTVRG
jgi:outer membrane lipoprotein SlyB